ncbi:LysM peptidoglycan-binding domain-containing protein [Cellulomonas cellasea]|uniref:Nucleoid-associated protein YgaU n=1 Tax=Cellulomonas cellasea TaxID=43670 RepID=A0A7W4UBW0_9CELL|nr:LysM peptidoglycan-binding domain-containing protein [Cellulomonas cellasea]MBB2921321.1 nucleoid-associated protein YgaU [Cellulomonas cellasea]
MTPTYAPARPRPRTIGEFARGLSAALALAGFVIGVPFLLAVIAPLRLPQTWPTWDAVGDALNQPDDGSLLLGLLAVIAWAGWAAFTASAVIETVASLRHIPAPSLPLLSWAQHLAGTLVTTAGLLLTTAAPVIGSSAGTPPVIATAPASAEGTHDSSMTGSSRAMTGSGRAATEADPTMTGPATDAPTASPPTAPPAAIKDDVGAGQAPNYPVVTVERGDTLWSLAERHLSSGHRYTEIRDLNLGQPQPDGRSLTDSHWIYPGWHLHLPTDALNVPVDVAAHEAGAGPSAAPPTPYEVVPGDTLWDIAATQLGDGAQYPAVFDLNAGVPQDDGRTLTDPDLIHPGWQLVLPAHDLASGEQPASAVAAPVPAAEAPAPANDQPPPRDERQRGADGVPSPDSARPTEEEPAVPRGDTQEGHDRETDGVTDEAEPPASVTHLVLGLTGLAAAGVIGELTRRRRLQHRRRRTGERIPLPALGTPGDEAERTLRTATTPLSIPQLKAALLNLATRAYRAERDLPRITTLHLSDTRLELHLADDDPEPLEPFTADGPRLWTATTATLADDVPLDDDPDRPEPYPALVTLGHTDNATVIANLEAAGTLAVTGDPNAAHDTLRAIVTELATSDLTGRVGILTGPEFAALAATTDPARLQCLDTSALPAAHTERARSIAAVLGANGVDDTLQARSDRTATDTWLPVVYLDALAHEGWRPPAPWSGSVLLTTSSLDGSSTLRAQADGSATLEPAGTELTVSRLTAEDLAQIADLLATAEAGSAPLWGLDGQSSDVDDNESVHALAAISAPDAPARADMGTGTELRINVLGPIEVLGLPTGARPLGKRSTELLVYLALRGRATGPELDDVLWHGRRVDNQTRNSLIYRTRQRVGAHNLPPVDADGHYHLGPDVTCDWNYFRRLAERGLATGTDEVQALREALELVRDRPLCGIAGSEYSWAEHDTQQIVAAIVDVAHILSTRLLTLGDSRGAILAATRGLLAEACSETLYDDAIGAAKALGDGEVAERLSVQLRATLEDLDPEYA